MDSTLRSTPFGRSPGRQLPFSTRLGNLADIPPAFRKTVARLLEGREQNVRHILFTPEFGTFGEYCPASLFIVTDHEWLAFSAESSSAPTVRYSDFAQTRLIEFSLALLQGRIVLEFGDAGDNPCVLRFSLTSWDLFRDALFIILSNGAQLTTGDIINRQLPPECADLSFSMRSTLQESLMPDDQLRELVAWTRIDAVSATDRLAIHPGGIVLTDRYLYVVTADDHTDRDGPIDLSVYNRGVVFLSRRFPILGRTTSHEGIDELELTVGNGAQTSQVSVLLPRPAMANIARILSPLATAVG